MRYRSTTGVALNQDADTANLVAPDGSVVDSFAYTNPGRDVSYSRAVDGTGDWIETYPPSPGDPNLPGTPPPTGAPTPTGTPTVTPTAVGTLTPTPTAGPLPLVRLNEILPRPDAIDWDGNGAVNAYDGWIEVINLDTWLSTWAGGRWTTLAAVPGPTSSRRGTLLEPGELPGALPLDHRCRVEPGRRHRAGCWRRTDGRSMSSPTGIPAATPATVGRWTARVTGPRTTRPRPAAPICPGTPAPTGTPTVTPTAVGTLTPTPTAGPLPLVRLNEILPRPDAIDWDGSGAVNAYDGWIEVINLDTEAIDLGGWALDDIAVAPGPTSSRVARC